MDDATERDGGGVALVGASASAVITGLVAAVLSFPVTCNTTFAPFNTDCLNIVGWSSFADYTTTAMVITCAAAVLAGAVVFMFVRFSDS